MTSTQTDDKPASVAETLRAARALLQDPKHWCQGAGARRRRRSVLAVMPLSPEAGAWCLAGALRRIDGPHYDEALIVLATTISGPVFVSHQARGYIASFNDARGRRHSAVIRVLDRAIAKAEGSDNS